MSAAGDLLENVAFQAAACRLAGSPLYGRLLDVIGDDIRAGGTCATILATDHHPEPLASALPLRFLGALHRIVLEGRAPALAAHYPSAGGLATEDPADDLLTAVRQHQDELIRRLGEPLQTNEVGRSAVLVGGYALVAREHGLPLRVLEIGASAGLNLRFDRYWYDTGESTFGDPASPVRFTGLWEGRPPDLNGPIEIAERRGCDPHPVDATSDEGRLALRSFVWPDQLERLARLGAALDAAAGLPLLIDVGDGPAWVEKQLAVPRPGVTTVVAHSIVIQYLAPTERRRLKAVMTAAGSRATTDAPLAWLRMEPAGERADLRLTTWPGGGERVLATAGYHGNPIAWCS